MTAVEKIIEYCKKQKNIDVNSHRGAYLNIINFCEQAKEMENSQRLKDFWGGYHSICMEHENIEDYFKQYIKSER